MKVTKLQIEDISIKDIDKMLLESDYVSNNEISTTLYLSFLLGKPMLIEGPPGVGKTELAKVIAKSFDRDFFRIQCYEGITFEQIVGEWNYQKQLLHLEAAKNDSNNVDEIFDDEFFIRRSLLNAFLNDNDSVLLIDEIDKADEEVESFLLQALGEQEITINDLGTFQLQNDLIVILTSNSHRLSTQFISENILSQSAPQDNANCGKNSRLDTAVLMASRGDATESRPRDIARTSLGRGRLRLS